jgi:hypothetical protein
VLERENIPTHIESDRDSGQGESRDISTTSRAEGAGSWEAQCRLPQRVDRMDVQTR